MTTSVTQTPSTPPPVTATATGTSSSTGSSSDPTGQIGLGSDFNTFLKLLTSQLQNQDPLSPLDTNQFTSQLVQFSQVEQAINANNKLASLVQLQSTDQTLSALPLVGHTVEYSDNQGPLSGGQAKFNYNLPAAASSATITISDGNGRIVYQGPADTTAGAHSFTWNGTGIDGSQLPDGIYTFNVAATDLDKQPLTVAVSALGKVDAVRVNNGTASIDLGGITETVGKILAVDDSSSS